MGKSAKILFRPLGIMVAGIAFVFSGDCQTRNVIVPQRKFTTFW